MEIWLVISLVQLNSPLLILKAAVYIVPHGSFHICPDVTLYETSFNTQCQWGQWLKSEHIFVRHIYGKLVFRLSIYWSYQQSYKIILSHQST